MRYGRGRPQDFCRGEQIRGSGDENPPAGSRAKPPEADEKM